MVEGWIVIPAYNEAQGIAAQLRVLGQFLALHAAEAGIRFTVLVVNDGSSDDTTAQVEAARADLQEVGVTLRLLEFARNFGHQAAVVAGLITSAPSADFSVTMDADGEQPHTLIPSLVEAWQRGAPIVHTVRKPHRGLGIFKRQSSAAYYRLLSQISGVRIRPGMADFKLWDGSLLREILPFLPNCGSTRVFAAWIAPRAPAVEYEQQLVGSRRSRFTLRKNISLATAGIIRYSDAPLRLALLMSLFAAVVAAAHSAFVLWAVWQGHAVPGWATIVIIVSFFGALQSFLVGVLGEYLLRISFRSSLPPFVTRASRLNAGVVRGGSSR